MIGHIRSHFKPMYNLYLVMKARDTPTEDEILMASGKKPFNDSIQAEYLKLIEEQATGIKEAFAKQQAKAAVRSPLTVLTFFLDYFSVNQEPWNQEKFEELLIEWMVTCDQPFDEVEKPEFIAAMSYGRTSSKFTLPKRDGVRRRVMKLGDETVEGIKAMFAVSLLICYAESALNTLQALEGKISLSLDAWTSSNCYAFLAIVAHYITNEGQCGECLDHYLYIYRSVLFQKSCL